MKKILVLSLALVFALSMTACGSNNQEFTVLDKDSQVEVVPQDQVPDGIENDGIGDDQDLSGYESPSGINDDGIGDDTSFGEGIGEVVALTPDEENYVMTQTTNTWLEMNRQEKDDLVALVSRSLEANYSFIVEDFDDLVIMLDHQMEQYL